MKYPTTQHKLATDKPVYESNSSYMVNIAQGRAHHNTLQHIHTTSPLTSQEDDIMQS